MRIGIHLLLGSALSLGLIEGTSAHSTLAVGHYSLDRQGAGQQSSPGDALDPYDNSDQLLTDTGLDAQGNESLDTSSMPQEAAHRAWDEQFQSSPNSGVNWNRGITDEQLVAYCTPNNTPSAPSGKHSVAGKSIAAVPEPAALGLCALGAGVLVAAGIARRQRPSAPKAAL